MRTTILRVCHLISMSCVKTSTDPKDILAMPPVFTVPANGKQIIRLGLRRPPDAQQELSYRLFLKEVPPPPKSDFQGVQMVLQISIPVFVAPPTPTKITPVWRATLTTTGMLKLSLHNQGNSHIQVTQLRLISADGASIPTPSITGYVLPQQQHIWPLANPTTIAVGDKVRLEAQTDAGPIHAELVIEQN